LKKRKPATSRGKVALNIVQTEHSFNRKLTRLRVQRKQVVFTTVVPFFNTRWQRSGNDAG
jgi:hypothetical protein